MTAAALTFGALPVLMTDPPAADYVIEALGEGTGWGNPTAVVASVASMLMDGEKAKITRFGNRQATIPLKIRGATLDAVAQGEAALMAEVNRGRNTLTWLPPGWSTPSVFDVVYSTLDYRNDDLAELNRVTRFYTLTLVCQPFARRALPSIVVAAPVPSGAPVVTSIDACTSTTGWSASSGVTLSTSGGAVVATGVTDGASVARTGLSVTVADGYFVRLELETDVNMTDLSFATPAGGNVPVYAISMISVTTTYKRRYFYLKVPTAFTGVTVNFDRVSGPPAQAKFHDISKVDRLPSAGPNQRSFTAAVGGTARTAADLVVEGASGLGAEVIVFTAPWAEAVDPPLRRWFTDAGSVVGGTVSGRANGTASDGPVIAHIPASVLPPGMHLVVTRARLGSGADADVLLQVTASLIDAPWVDPVTDVSVGNTVPMTSAFTNYPVGVVQLPTAAVDTTSGATVEIKLDAPGEEDVRVDEIWLFNLDTGVLTWFIDLTVGGSTPSKIEIRSATIDRDRPQWIVGTTGTDTDSIDASARAASPGIHEFASGLMSIFVVTPGVTEQTVSLELYERFQHHVTPLGF